MTICVPSRIFRPDTPCISPNFTDTYNCVMLFMHTSRQAHGSLTIIRLRRRLSWGTWGRVASPHIYRALINNTPTSLDRLRTQWEEWVGTLEEKDWREALMAPRMVTASAKLRMVQLYYLHSAYLTPVRLHRAGFSPTPACARCGHEPADFFHMV